jgi:hypothetical protein
VGSVSSLDSLHPEGGLGQLIGLKEIAGYKMAFSSQTGNNLKGKNIAASGEIVALGIGRGDTQRATEPCAWIGLARPLSWQCINPFSHVDWCLTWVICT